MRTKTLLSTIAALALLGTLAQAALLGTAFTYQGKLTDNGAPAQGIYDLRFTIYDAAAGGTLIAGPQTNSAVAVSNGLFTVTLDFGAGVFAGDARWLEIAARTNATGAFATFPARQSLTAAPYAVYAANAGTAATANGVAANAVIAAGQVVTSLNGLSDAVTLAAGTNVTFATNGHVLQISAATNGAGGSAWLSYKENGPFANGPVASGINAIAQGEHAQALGIDSVVGGGLDNLAGPGGILLLGRTTVAGGEANQAVGDWATVGGGQLNTAGGPLFGRATVAGGWQNSASGDMSTISGGSQNSALAGHGVIGGGQSNIIITLQAPYATIGGGHSNAISTGAYATISGGSQNVAMGGHGAIGGGQSNSITTLQAPWSTIGGGHLNQISAMSATIGGGVQNQVSGWSGVVAGGNINLASGYTSMVGGGELNEATNNHTFVGGGNRNKAYGDASTVAGGNVNTASGAAATVPGGYNNRAIGDYSFAAGQSAVASAPGSIVFADSQPLDFVSNLQNEFAVRALNGLRLQSDVGIHLNAADRPLIVRDWDPFASTAPYGKANIGRWGLFMEPGRLVLGIPRSDVGYREMQVARYATDGTSDPVFRVGNDGITTVKVLTITGGSDLAEPFTMTDGRIPKGAVVVIDDQNPGQLKLSDRPYDRRVAGIVSGANGVTPGITLRQDNVLEGTQNVALTGRAYALADAANGPIRPGDLLTTSATPGHAMKATDPARSQGAILGKAMSPLQTGRGLVLVLVSLQ